jgi:peptidoglycan/LPS O-acetylase OafA/YrhL
MSTGKRILWADLARGLAAYAVIAYHMDVPGTKYFYVAVDFFFVLSGFVLSRSISRITNFAEWRHFMLKRLYRFMPLVWMALFVRVSLAFGGTLVGKPCDAAECELIPVISAALMLQFIVPIALTVMGPLWSLSIELIVNAVYALPLMAKRKGLVIFGILAGLGFLIFTYLAPQFDIPNFLDRGFARGVLAFGLGLLIGYLPKLRSAWLAVIPGALGTGLVFITGVGFQPLVAAFMFALLVWGLSQIQAEWDNTVYVKVAALLGNASFGVYVWHGAFRGVVQQISQFIGFEAGTTVFALSNFVVLSALSTVLALVTYHYVEMPIMRRFSQRSK